MSPSYDAAGNIMSDDFGGPYQYDCNNRLAKVYPGQPGEIDYFYDGANRRVKSVGGGTTTYYIWEGNQVIAEYTNGPAAGSGLKFYHPDILSTRMSTGGNGAVIGTQDNLPFGEDAGVSGNLEKHRFTNYERDPDGSDYAVNRQYSTSIGRFRQPDPMGGSIGNPQSLNGYAYAMGDPVNLADPSGLYTIPLNNPFFDAGLFGPGLYIDGIRVITEGEYQIFFGLLSSGSGALAPMGSTVTLANGGYYISMKTGYPPGDDFHPSQVSFFEGDDETHEDMIKRTLALVLDILKIRKACRDLLAGTGSGKNAFNYLYGMKYSKNKIVEGGLIDDENLAETPPTLLSDLDITYPTIHLGSQFFSKDGPAQPWEGDFYPRLAPDMRREMTILHELGHATGAKAAKHLPAGLDNAESSGAYNQEIYDKCLSW
jgi:RHS repeat-associated protein